MAFGVYVHIPYCLQRCVYCDFATYELSQILSPQDYIKRVQSEIKTKSKTIGPRPLDTLYFGGGTPSLISPDLLNCVIQTLSECGFPLKHTSEVTLEINPATTDQGNLEKLIGFGFNRFSVGAQTFDDRLLKIAHRRHSAQDTIDTLSLLKKYSLNFSLDVLFALQTQTLYDLKKDLDIALSFSPPHVSPYCLTVPETNPMAKGRAPEDEQVEMFDLLKTALEVGGLARYEISNFSRPGLESRHNMLYWDDDEYWGVGLSSHSYMHWGSWGSRFWNPRGIDDYVKATDASALNWESSAAHENLMRHQALTDYFHISLRKTSGIDPIKFERKFGSSLEDVAGPRLKTLLGKGWLIEEQTGFSLSETGLVLSNQVFEELTFLSPPLVDKNI